MAGVPHDSFRVHDLLLLRRGLLSAACVAQPAWLTVQYPANRWVVVRRSVAPEGLVAVGVRGNTRQERWGGYADSADIIERLRPSQLSSERLRRARFMMPALATLSWLEGKIGHSVLDWGPVGSVGFELASGQQVVTTTSDLDIAVFAPAPFTREAVSDLWRLMKDAPAKIDVRIETPLCGFSLEEYAREGTETVLIRLSDRQQFATDPWNISAIKDEA